MESLIYPLKTMHITQNYNGKLSHYNESHAKDYTCYPIDDAGKNTGREWFYAPCDLIIKRIYGVGNKGTNTVWLESINKVKLANGDVSYITIRVTHPEDDDLSKLKVGQKFKKYEKMFREGKDGYATGNHFHICVSACKFNELYNKGWIKNSNGSWVTSPLAIKPEDAFFVDSVFTNVQFGGNLMFKDLSIKNETLYLPSSATSWRVYKLNVAPVKGNECGYLKPFKFGGLTYQILRWTSKNVCVIKTRDFGEVQIYVAPSTGAIIK